MKADNYFFLKTPFPIQITKELTRAEKDVWSAVFSLREIYKRSYPSVRQIAALSTNGDRANARRHLRSLEEKGLMQSRKKRVRGMNLTDYLTLWPDWLNEECDDRFLLRENRPEQAHESDEWGEDVPIPEESKGSQENPPRGSQENPPKLGRENPPSKTNREDSRDSKANGVPFADPKQIPEGPPEEDEELDRNYDGDSREEIVNLLADKENRSRGKKKRQKRIPSNSKFLSTPSQRWEFRSHLNKPIPKWGGFDIIGYWICRHLEFRKMEDESFFVGSTSSVYIQRCAKNAKLFIKRYLDGDMRRAKEAVDGILEYAEEKDRPVAFAYYFTPKSDSALREVLSERGINRRPRREKTLREMNNESGTDMAYWQRKMEAEVAAREAKKERA